MSDSATKRISTDMIFNLEDNPPPIQAFLAAVQHMMAIFVGIITPPAYYRGGPWTAPGY